MKKLFTVSVIGAAMMLSACASQDSSADYSYESQAPYASERTVGKSTSGTTKGDAVFKSSQRK